MPYKKINVGRLQKEEWFVTKYDLRLTKGNTYGHKRVGWQNGDMRSTKSYFLFSLYHLDSFCY